MPCRERRSGLEVEAFGIVVHPGPGRGRAGGRRQASVGCPMRFATARPACWWTAPDPAEVRSACRFPAGRRDRASRHGRERAAVGCVGLQLGSAHRRTQVAARQHGRRQGLTGVLRASRATSAEVVQVRAGAQGAGGEASTTLPSVSMTKVTRSAQPRSSLKHAVGLGDAAVGPSVGEQRELGIPAASSIPRGDGWRSQVMAITWLSAVSKRRGCPAACTVRPRRCL